MSKGKYNNFTSKENSQNNKLNKHCLRFPSKTPKLHHWYNLNVLIASFEQCSAKSYVYSFKIFDSYEDMKWNDKM